MSATEPQLRASKERLQHDIDQLSTYVEDGTPGWSRRVFSTAYREEREQIRRLMVDAGLETHVDAVGNIIGVLRGKNPAAAPLMTGSHTDTVHAGGRFDGIVGVLGAIETARLMRESGQKLERDLVIVDFIGEEANPYGVSCLGSRSIGGVLTAEHLDRVNPETGDRLGDTMTGFGINPEQAIRQAWKPGSLEGYVELHVEQGPQLERSGNKIGVVTAIAGIERLMANFQGRADHSGTMPMQNRQDALLAAAEAILTVERVGCGAPIHGVSTTGKIESSPGSFNIVPDEARIWAEMRSVDAEWLNGAKGRIAENIAKDAAERGVETAIEWLNDQEPVPTAQSVQDRIASVAADLGADWEAIPSGAGHDAAHLGGLGPMGMIFIPSVGGRSHVPEEFTSIHDITLGVDVLATTLKRMDEPESH